MGKAPAFQFYAVDFLSGTSELSAAEVGIYTRMMAYSWDKGPLPLDHARLARMTGVTVREFAAAWPAVGKKWVVREGEGYINERLEQQRAEREAFASRQSDKAASRWKKPSGGNGSGSPAAYAAADTTAHAAAMPRHAGGTSRRDALQSSISDLQPPLTEEQSEGGNTRARDEGVNRGGGYRPVNPHSRSSNLVNGAEQRAHGSHAWCSWPARDGLCVPTLKFHRELMGKTLKSDADLRAIYARVVARHEGIAVTGDIFAFWEREVSRETAADETDAQIARVLAGKGQLL